MASLALGTVQFGLPYGIANRAGQTEQPEVDAMLRFARQSGLDLLDTAIAYGDSEARLGRAGVRDWKVVTKLPPLPGDVEDVTTWVRDHIAASMQRLGVNTLEGVLLHRSRDLLETHGIALAAALDALTSSGRARSVGVSIYDPGELDALWAVWRPGLIQAPCSVLDRRLEHSGWLTKLASHGVRVHARSVFLQGLLLMRANSRPAAFDRWCGLLDRWLGFCDQVGLPPSHVALGYVLSCEGVERAVVGADSMTQLRELITNAVVDTPPVPPDLFSDDCELLEPSRWKLS